MKMPAEDLRRLFLKLDTNVLVLLRRGVPLFLFQLEKGAVHSIVRDLQFLGNFSHGIAFISQNKNRLTGFRRKVFVSGHFEPVIEPKNADATDTQLVKRRPV